MKMIMKIVIVHNVEAWGVNDRVGEDLEAGMLK